MRKEPVSQVELDLAGGADDEPANGEEAKPSCEGEEYDRGEEDGDLRGGREGVDGLLRAHGLAEDVDAFTGQPWDGEQRADRQRHYEESRQVAAPVASREREDETNTVQVAGLSTGGDCSAGILCPLRLSWRSFPVKSSPFGSLRKDSRAYPGGANIDFDGGLREFIQGYEEKPAGKRPENFEIGRVR